MGAGREHRGTSGGAGATGGASGVLPRAAVAGLRSGAAGIHHGRAGGAAGPRRAEPRGGPGHSPKQVGKGSAWVESAGVAVQWPWGCYRMSRSQGRGRPSGNGSLRGFRGSKTVSAISFLALARSLKLQ